ncbi:MAG: phosphate ABC transporter substrate-binding protein PstS [Victivallaceae bacterium]|nr:phosphate ABC transporter substrate-binding protein PstS [Victivallaceae bacterium]
MKNKVKNMLSAALAIMAMGSLNASAEQKSVTINGAGASFPAPVYQLWTYNYSQATSGVTINYQSIGSGAGINQIKAKTVDFAGTDNPLTLEEQNESGLVQFPMLTGGVVVIVNIPGVKSNDLKLDRAVLADIFLGKITKWNDAKIKALNPNVALPALDITVVRRADASGTSFIFTNYLSKISQDWKDNVGFGASVKWPVGIGGQKNPGVCNNVAKIRGSIGYTEYTYAVEANLSTVLLENQAGSFVAPSPESFSVSAASADWQNAPGYYMVLTDQPGTGSWPITGVTYILLRKDCDPALRAEIVKYVNWCYTSGAETAKKLNYVPIPENVVKLVQDTVLK